MTSRQRQSTAPRYYGLDGLRAVMMLLGLVLHAIVSYMHVPASHNWPFRDPSAHAVWTHLQFFIHIFRMPVFYVMAGFFAALLVERRGTIPMLRNRTTRVLIPFVVGWVVLKPLVGLGFDFANAAKNATISEAWDVVRATPIADQYTGTTIHLWFLYYLLLLYAAGVVLVAAARCLPASWRVGILNVFSRLVESRWRACWFAIPTAGTLALAPYGILRMSFSFIPDPLAFLTYGVFFVFGWLLYLKRELLPTFDRHAWLQVVLALTLAPVNLATAEYSLLNPGEKDAMTIGVTAVSGALIVWLLIFGLIGLFQRHLNRPNPVIRYIVDASYWVYLIHLPFTIWIQGLLVGLPWPSTFKIVAMLVLATPIWWASYNFLVRSTFIGVTLNGRRYPRGLPGPESPPMGLPDEKLPRETVGACFTPALRSETAPPTDPQDKDSRP